MKKILTFVLAAVLTLTFVTACGSDSPEMKDRAVRPPNEKKAGFVDLSPGEMPPASLSRSQLVAMFTADSDGEGGGDLCYDEAEAAYPPAAEADKGTDAVGGDYAKTNVQHEGIDEGDIIKVDGGYIYMLSQEGLVIVGVSKAMEVTCRIKYDNFFPDEMFIFENRLVVIGGIYSQLSYGFGAMIDGGLTPWYGYRTSTRIIVYNLNDRVNVKTLAEYDVSGYFVTSRLIESRLIVTVNHTVNRRDRYSYIPSINGEEINCEDIYVYDTPEGYNNYYYSFYTVIASMDLNILEIEAVAHLGLQGTAYFSMNNIYFFSGVYKYNYYGENYDWQNYGYRLETFIVKIDLSTLLYCASARIDGQLSDRYWADEYEENLRVVTLSSAGGYTDGVWFNKTFSNVYVLDKNLNALGSITGIAPGERIYAVRFNKTEGSIVTFLQIDPLFKLNLSDPKNPVISAGLKEDGVSDYLQYLSDDVVLGLGRNTEPNIWGGTDFSGMKISVYDNTGADMVNMNTVDIGRGRVNSEALWNPKAILNDTARSMFSFAVTDYGDNDWRNLNAQGLAVFGYDLNAADNGGKLVYRGLLANVQPGKTYSTWEDYYDDFYAYVKRGARIGNRIYTISERYVACYDIDSLSLIQRLKISDIHVHRLGAEKVTKASGCYKNGEAVRACTVAGCGYKSTYTLWAEHKMGDYKVTKAAACTQNGSSVAKCSVCGYKSERTVWAEHSMGNYQVISAAGCTENGAYSMTCTAKGCGHKQEYTIWALGHSLVWNTKVPATCTEDGLETATCARAGCSHSRTRVIFASHSFSSWAVTKAATCSESGVQTSYCTRAGCGHVRTQIIWPTAHDWGGWVSSGHGKETRVCKTNSSHTETRLVWIA